MKLILIALFLTGCTHKPITLKNAEDRCYLYGVKVSEVREVMPEITINVVGKDVQNYCGVGVIACVINGRHIYLHDNDWWAINHETCHIVSKTARHIKKQKEFESIESRADAQ